MVLDSSIDSSDAPQRKTAPISSEDKHGRQSTLRHPVLPRSGEAATSSLEPSTFIDEDEHLAKTIPTPPLLAFTAQQSPGKSVLFLLGNTSAVTGIQPLIFG